MSKINKAAQQFLGRFYDERTDAWYHEDRSGGVYTNRHREDVLAVASKDTGNAIEVMNKLDDLRKLLKG